ncbi:hypothetical protein D9758_012176 [Tetrapyrgos nigripes]|uniref:Fungal lipase-type domain-containing protein n=1 Tax=Tetrapyrgos nigripes TaxID=182062 RepID=A0A8H5FKT6_9AGAR|nr:hypothetical protein D9758_012176 [Tetrapyrgos nigripes]
MMEMLLAMSLSKEVLLLTGHLPQSQWNRLCRSLATSKAASNTSSFCRIPLRRWGTQYSNSIPLLRLSPVLFEMLSLSVISLACLLPFFTWTYAGPNSATTTSIAAVNEMTDFGVGPSSEVTPLSAEEISELVSFAQFARAAYCRPALLEQWACGTACNALPDFVPTLVGGDGNLIQNYYVGYWESRQAIVVGHEGTDPTQLLALLTDIDIVPVPLPADLFPGVPSEVRVHHGFRTEHARTANIILNEVIRLMNGTGSKTVITTGHSLGGALAVLDSLFFSLHLPKDTHILSRTFGTPRIGNIHFARLIDSSVRALSPTQNTSFKFYLRPL